MHNCQWYRRRSRRRYNRCVFLTIITARERSCDGYIFSRVCLSFCLRRREGEVTYTGLWPQTFPLYRVLHLSMYRVPSPPHFRHVQTFSVWIHCTIKHRPSHSGRLAFNLDSLLVFTAFTCPHNILKNIFFQFRMHVLEIIVIWLSSTDPSEVISTDGASTDPSEVISTDGATTGLYVYY